MNEAWRGEAKTLGFFSTRMFVVSSDPKYIPWSFYTHPSWFRSLRDKLILCIFINIATRIDAMRRSHWSAVTHFCRPKKKRGKTTSSTYQTFQENPIYTFFYYDAVGRMLDHHLHRNKLTIHTETSS
jgi:hypothetical protein